MEPNIALDKLREMCRETIASFELLSGSVDYRTVEVAEHFEALDQWLSNGGFLPSEWQDARRE